MAFSAPEMGFEVLVVNFVGLRPEQSRLSAHAATVVNNCDKVFGEEFSTSRRASMLGCLDRIFRKEMIESKAA
jgi:diphthamide biosynthesis methyltransferase